MLELHLFFAIIKAEKEEIFPCTTDCNCCKIGKGLGKDYNIAKYLGRL
jgi:hypothetical protein